MMAFFLTARVLRLSSLSRRIPLTSHTLLNSKAMSAQPAAKRARAPALDAVVSTVAAPGLGRPNGLFVLADGTLLACAGNSIRVLAPSGLLPALLLAGNNTSRGKKDGPGADARFDCTMGITVDPAGNVVVVDLVNHALRLVSKAGAVSTLAGGGGAGFADGQGAAARLLAWRWTWTGVFW